MRKKQISGRGFFLGGLIFSLIIMGSCKNQSTVSLTKEDSLGIAKLVKPQFKFQKINYAVIPPSEIKDPDSIRRMIDCYKANPLLIDPGSSLVTEYFLLDSLDWEALMAIQKISRIKTLKFQLAVKNFKQVNDHLEDPVYTMITFPIGKSFSSASGTQGFDYICPCPGSPCCPK